MLRNFLKSKIHQATITQAELYYVGSLTIDEDLMDAADVKTYEKVSVVNINNGERFETYVIPGVRGSGTICLNGAAARKGAVGDLLIIMSYCLIDSKEIEGYHPTVVLLDKQNKIQSITEIIEATK
ncbi:MAG: aspartate 1-decarboxylase [Candidatus Kapabacteria bacterium]|nr:aspartate 1-decarboxylase [Ignavibacteriota bacterium]MCW5886103.1 aspartate 1-decarboxylase [Candidatus Kapabacteria bacterium]